MGMLSFVADPMLVVGVSIALFFVAATYTFITWDRTRAGSANKDDTQVGLKLVLFALIIASISVLASGLRELLAFVLGGFKGGSMPVRAALPAIFVGGGAIAVILKVLLPRTNMNQYTQAARFTVGVLALYYGVWSIVSVYLFLLAMFTNVGGWSGTSSALAMAFVSVALAFPAMRSFGSMSGWVEPPKPTAYPPQGGYGGPPVGGPGYPPQGGYGPGSGPVGGAPPGGGYGGPPSGGMPPQGGGGMPPQGGGGYGPPGGGGGYGPPGGGGGGYPPR